jgi:membrane protease YdiL (CAAX protease family)
MGRLGSLLASVSHIMQWQRVPASDMRIERSKQETITALSYALFFIAAAWGTGMIIHDHPLPILGATGFTSDLWYVLVFKIVFLLIIPWQWFRKQGYGLRDLMPGWSVRPGTIAALVVSFVVGLSLNQALWPPIVEAAGKISGPELLIRVLLGVVLPLLTAGIPEEIVYRGILQTRLERSGGRITAILVSALLFAGWHLPTRFLLAHGVEGTAGDLGSVLVGTGLPVFVVGVVFGVFWDRYRSILPLIAAHWAIDLAPHLSSMLGIRW